MKLINNFEKEAEITDSEEKIERIFEFFQIKFNINKNNAVIKIFFNKFFYRRLKNL